MKLYFMKSDALDTLKSNLPKESSHYFTDDDNRWIYDLCDGDPFEDTGIEVDDFSLAPLDGSLSAGAVDLENCKRIYSNLMELNETQAGDERLWAGLTNGIFYSYMRKRWKYDERGPGKELSDAAEIETRFFFKGGKRSGFFRNTLSKCWWVGRDLYSPNESNPFRKLDILGPSDLNSKISTIFYSNTFSSNPAIVDGIIMAIDHYNRLGVRLIEKTHIRPAMAILNAVGGRIILDCLSPKEIAEILIEAIDEIRTGRKTIHFEDNEADSEVDQENQEPETVQLVKEGNTVSLLSLDGSQNKKFAVKKIQGKIPALAASLIGKKLQDEVKIGDKTYVVVSIK